MVLKLKFMRFFLLLSIIILSSCENKKEIIVNRQQTIKEEMEKVKAFYYKKLDSLESVKETDTNSAKRQEIAEELVSTDGKKSVALIKLQKEYDSLEVELKKY
jgi:Ulp1 family protease